MDPGRARTLVYKALRSPRAALVGLVAFVLGWHLWAVLTDQRLSGCSVDIFIPATLQALDHLRKGELAGLLLGGMDPKGPVAPALAALLTHVAGDVVLGCRLVSVLAHCAMMVQLYDLGRFLPQGARGRLWAPLYCGVTPLVFGWARLEFHEPLMTVLVLGALQIMLRARLDRALPAVWLGLLLGLGLLTKLSFPVFLVAPGLWFVARRVRSFRAAAYLLLALGIMTALFTPWLRTHLPVVMDNFFGSSHGPELWREVLVQFFLPDHTVWLLALALASALLLWWRRGADRWVVALLALSPLVCLALFVVRFHYWTRYMLPVYAVLALLCGAGVSVILERLPRPWALPLGGALALGLLGSFVQINLSEVAVHGVNREYSHGMLAPDQDLYNGYTLTTRPFRAAGLPVMEVILPGFAHTRWVDMSRIWRWRGLQVKRLDPAALLAGSHAGRTVGVVMVGKISEQEQEPGVYEGKCPPWSEELYRTMVIRPEVRFVLRRGRARCLVTVIEPDHLSFAALALELPP